LKNSVVVRKYQFN